MTHFLRRLRPFGLVALIACSAEPTEPDNVVPSLYGDGVVIGSIDQYGGVLLELRQATSNFVWTGRGVAAGSQISGQWASNYQEAGGFTAVLSSKPRLRTQD